MSRPDAASSAGGPAYDDLLYRVSHDLHEPLRMVLGYGGLLERRLGERLAGEEAEFLAMMTGASRRMQGMLDGLLALSRANTRPISPRALSWRPLAEEVFARRQRALDGAAIATDVRGDGVLFADRERLGQALGELVDNAIAWADDAETIALSLTTDGRMSKIEVRDDGCGLEGVDPASQMSLFTTRARHEADGHAGTGLPLVRAIAQRHGGDLWLRRSEHGGAVAKLTIPAPPDAVASQERP